MFNLSIQYNFINLFLPALLLFVVGKIEEKNFLNRRKQIVQIISSGRCDTTLEEEYFLDTAFDNNKQFCKLSASLF